MSVHVKRAPGQPATKRKIGLSANTLAQAAYTTATQAAASADAAAADAAAIRADLAARAFVLVDAPEPGVWVVGPDWRGRNIDPATDTAVMRSTVVDAPEPGVWVIGPDWRGRNITGTTAPVDIAAAAAGRSWSTRTADGTVRPMTSDLTRILVTGDSLDKGYPTPPFAADGTNAWPGVLATLCPGVTITNIALHGQTAAEAALRQGGLVLVTTADFTLPADTSKVTLPAPGLPTAFAGAFTFAMTVDGVPVTVTHTNSTTWQVNRTTASGSVTTVPAGTALISSVAQPGSVNLLAGGRNDVLAGMTTANMLDRVNRAVAAFAGMVDSLTPAHPSFLIIGTITATNEPAGTLHHTYVTTLNARLKQLWPSQFWDRRKWLISSGLAAAGITPTPADLAAINGDTVPPSLSHDGLHYTTEAANVIAAQIKVELQKRGIV